MASRSGTGLGAVGFVIALVIYVLIRLSIAFPPLGVTLILLVTVGLFFGIRRMIKNKPRAAKTRASAPSPVRWDAPPGWTYTETDTNLPQRLRDAGLTVTTDDEVSNVLTSTVGSLPVVVFQTRTQGGWRTWCVVWAGELSPFRARAVDSQVLEVEEGSYTPNIDEAVSALTDLEGVFSRVETRPPFVVSRLVRNDPRGVRDSLLWIPEMVQLTKALIVVPTQEPVGALGAEPLAASQLGEPGQAAQGRSTGQDADSADGRESASEPQAAQVEESASADPWAPTEWKPTTWTPPDYGSGSR